MLKEVGLSRCLKKVPLLQPDIDVICSKLPTATAADIQSMSSEPETCSPWSHLGVLVLQLFTATGLRPSSIWRTSGTMSEWPGMLMKDISIKR